MNILKKKILGASIGNCVHVAGVVHFLSLAEQEGYDTLFLGPAVTTEKLFEKMVSNMVEVKSRGAYVLGVTSYGNYAMEDTADFTIYVPKTMECFATSLVVIPLQLLAYYISVSKGLDVDKPRNLAKSVTVE